MLHRGCLRDSPLNLLRRPVSGKIPWCRHDLRLEEVTVHVAREGGTPRSCAVCFSLSFFLIVILFGSVPCPCGTSWPWV